MKKALLVVLPGYFIWGFQPLFWNLTDKFSSMFILAFRILMAFLFSVAILAVTKKLPLFKKTLFDWKKMRFLLPATLLMFMDWALFIYAVTSGHVLDTSLGYYISPLISVLLSLFLFREKSTPLQLAAVGVAFLGVIISAIQYGKIPVLSLLLALSSIYAAIKKFAGVDAIVSIAIETLLMSAFSVVYLLFFSGGEGGFASISAAGDVLFLIATGIVTATPMMLYSYGINKLPFFTVGFLQYLTPTLALFCGFLMGETFTSDKLLTFAFVCAGLIIYSIATVYAERKKRQQLATAEFPAAQTGTDGDK